MVKAHIRLKALKSIGRNTIWLVKANIEKERVSQIGGNCG